MMHTNKKSSERQRWSKTALKAATEAVKRDGISTKRAAEEYGIPRQTLERNLLEVSEVVPSPEQEYLTHYRNNDKMAEQTTGRQLQRILHYSVTPCRPLMGMRRSECALYDVDCDEVYPRLYIGDASAARNKQYLRLIGITHVLNSAEGTRFGQVDTGHSYYRDMSGVRYMGFHLVDQPTTDISRYFYIASKFIENGINSGGKVLVHCMVGMSRSATCVLAYLMIARKMSAAEAIRTVRMHRDIRPNEGFLQQLADLDNELKRDRMYY